MITCSGIVKSQHFDGAAWIETAPEPAASGRQFSGSQHFDGAAWIETGHPLKPFFDSSKN